METIALNQIISPSILNSMYNSIIITTGKLEGPDHPKILYVNKSFENMSGYTQDELIGKTPRIFQGDNTDQKTIYRLKTNLQENKFFEGSTVNYKKDGSEYHVEWNITPIKDMDGNTKYFLGIQKDITENVKYKKQLEKQVEDNLKQIKLQKDLIELQSKHAAIGEMIDAIAHQWLNPLTKIRMKEQMIKFFLDEKEFHDHEVDTYLDDAINLTYYMEETLQEFRSFLRPTDKKEKIPFNDLIQSVSILLKDDLLSNKIELETKNLDEIYVNVNPNEFKHVLINLISNSKDAFVQNNIQNRKIIIEGSINENKPILKVSDNAGGIPNHLIEHIFEQNVTSKKEIGGTGIGLYMSQQILTKHDVKIYVSNINNGACFRLEFEGDFRCIH